ncbi:CYTH domain-containing protein [Massilia sp. PWRC2]|uniref:CYTH domain-containing protein n=1 Tax=Massilia sp. PWRC2 TaxID=2804626 RepID=UPI003CF11F1F
MGVEIERKFLLAGDGWRTLGVAVAMRQGYLSSDKARVVRVRIEGEQAYLTIKGQSVGATRAEWEYAIPLADAEQLLLLCEQPLVEKVRRRIALGPHVWEVDEFFGVNQGLVMAEIELASEQQAFDKPAWIGAEVTADPRYYNSALVKLPYTRW